MMNFTLKAKILCVMILAVCLPVIVTATLVSQISTDLIQSSSENALHGIAQNKSYAVKSYFETIKNQMETFSENKMVVDATLKLRQQFPNYLAANKLKGKIKGLRAKLSQYYTGDFAEQYAVKNRGKTVDASALVNSLDPSAVALQYDFIFANEHPLGSKHLLDSVKDDMSGYSETHESAHPIIRNYLEKFGYYDIFIVDAESGHIIYSVFKELDFATSLISGPYKDSGIGQAFMRARGFSQQDQVTLTDYAPYLPSYEAAASFIASPIMHNNQTIAVAIFQMPIDRLTTVMSSREGLGKTGESYIVGNNLLPRSNSYLDEKNRTVEAAFRYPENGRMESTPIKLGLQGESGIAITENYLGTTVISSFQPLDILNHRWVMIAEISKQEAFAAVNQLFEWIILSSAAIILTTVFFGWILGSRLANTIAGNVENISNQTKSLEATVEQMSEESQRLAQNVVTSASAVQETASSLSEINSTLQTNSQTVNVVVERANEVLDELKDADQQLLDIDGSFVEIGKGVQKNNEIIDLVEEISERTKMINEIVFKTQLLAVNASIEAARAGDQGKGFAVVADEVTKLASLSGNAAEQIDKLIVNSRKIIVGIVKSNQSIVDQSQGNAKNFRQLFERMTRDIRSVLESTRDIAGAINEQKQGVSQVSIAMDEIDHSVQNNQQQSESSRQLAESIREITSSLTSVSRRFESLVSGRQEESKAKETLVSSNQEVETDKSVDADDDSFQSAA